MNHRDQEGYNGDDNAEGEEEELRGEELMSEEEGEEEDLNHMPSTPSPILPGCEYSEQEEDWAWEIVQAIEGQHNNADIRICSDFEYMALGIYAQGDVQKALRSARGMQLLRETYNVQDTVEECMDMIQQFIALQPGAILHLDILDSQQGEGLVVWNHRDIVPARTNTEAKFRIHILATYYIDTILFPDFRACREGAYFLVEGKDAGWENFDAELTNRLHYELYTYFPGKVKRVMVYNTNSVVNMAWGLYKRILPKQFWDSMELGCQIEWDDNDDNPKLALSDLYLLPDYNTAMQHFLQRARSMAERRFRNQEEFRL